MSIVDGAVKIQPITVEGRKIPLKDIRKGSIQDHLKYMRLRTDNQFEEMSRDQLLQQL